MFFKNLQVYRLPRKWEMSADDLATALSSQSFTPPSSSELLRQGWDTLRPDGGLVHAVGGQYLIESLAIKSVKPLDVLTEDTRGTSRNDEERFDSEFTLMAGELAKLLADLVESLGGEAAMGSPEVHATVEGQKKMERAVGLSADLYKNRAMHREVLNELYEQTVKPYIDLICGEMKKNGTGEVETAIALAQQQPAGSSAAQMLLVAAVEIIEPSEKPAKGDEPVREQRPVLSLHDHVAGQLAARGLMSAQAADTPPAGDGSATDPLYEQAVQIVRTNRRASISLIQRHLRVGYNRAARLLEAMEGTVVGPMLSSGTRELLAQGGAA